MSTVSSDALATPLVQTLNTLLSGLDLPFVLDSPIDLTPSLLLALLESLLEDRLPIPPSVRDSRDRAARVQAMKIFLGVLENDVIKQDVGLSDIDPRRLAAGEWEETVFVGELLCWLGKQMGFLRTSRGPTELMPAHAIRRGRTFPSAAIRGSSPRRIVSPSTGSTLTASALSMTGVELESNTTMLSVSVASDRHHVPSPRHLNPSPSEPLCIHELGDPSFLVQDKALFGRDTSLTYQQQHSDEDSFTSSSSRSVRYDGYIEEVDVASELQEFEDLRMTQSHSYISSVATTVSPPNHGQRLLTRHASPTQHTLALLNERARLLSQLANIELNLAR